MIQGGFHTKAYTYSVVVIPPFIVIVILIQPTHGSTNHDTSI